MKRHANIPVFIPHLGCPNMCVFCNQRTISGTKEFDADSVIPIIENALSTLDVGIEAEIAFFGGSFTGIPEELMERLLKIAYSYVSSGRVRGIRCSTRPDYINEQVLKTLKKYGVRVIELGLQSVDESVLSATKRGHSFEDERRACKLITEGGFTLVGQMMIGLPNSTPETELETADFIISCGASAARIYPTVVFRDTELCRMSEEGKYSPLSEADAVARAASVILKFIKAGVDVIRIGLCASENLASPDTYYAGPNHPALGELVLNEVYKRLICEAADAVTIPENAVLHITVPLGALSKAIGQKRKNKDFIILRYALSDVIFSESSELMPYEIAVKAER